jgi:hypothetical protein
MVGSFLIHPMNFAFQADSIADFLREAAARGDPSLSAWTVALPTEGRAGPVSLESLPEAGIQAGKRRVKVSSDDGSLLVSGKSARVGGRSDVRHALTKDEMAELIGDKGDDWKEDDVRAAMHGPLLVIYPLRGVVARAKPETWYRERLVLPALGLHFPGVRDPDGPRNVVRYRLNRVAQKELLPDDFDDDDEVTDDLDQED